jgi:hypothetical protein
MGVLLAGDGTSPGFSLKCARFGAVSCPNGCAWSEVLTAEVAGSIGGDRSGAPSGLLLSRSIPEWVNTDQQVANVVRDELFCGLIAHWSRLSDESLATTLGVSRSTGREAIQMLASEGLVQRTLRSRRRHPRLTTFSRSIAYRRP